MSRSVCSKMEMNNFKLTHYPILFTARIQRKTWTRKEDFFNDMEIAA